MGQGRPQRKYPRGLSRAGQVASTGLRLWIAAFLAACILAGAANAQATYPDRPVRLIAPFAPGGPVDVVARLLAPKLSEIFGQQFYVENHPGASGNIGTALVAKAPGDGYTILVISSTLVVNPSLFGKLGFDTYIDLAPISLVGVSPQILLVHPSVPAHDIAELIARVKASPGKYSYAHAGVGTPGFLAGEMFKQAFGLDLVAVSFNGGAPAMTSTIGGHTPILYTSISTAGGYIKQGSVRPLAVTGARRCRMFLPWLRPEHPIRNRKSFSVCSLPAERRGRSSIDCSGRSFGCSPCLKYTNAWPHLGSSRSAARQRNSRTASERRSRNGQRSSARPALRRSRFTPALIAHDQHRAFGVAHHMARIGAEKISAHRVALCPARGHDDEIGPHAVRLFQNLLVDAALADGG